MTRRCRNQHWHRVFRAASFVSRSVIDHADAPCSAPKPGSNGIYVTHILAEVVTQTLRPDHHKMWPLQFFLLQGCATTLELPWVGSHGRIDCRNCRFRSRDTRCPGARAEPSIAPIIVCAHRLSDGFACSTRNDRRGQSWKYSGDLFVALAGLFVCNQWRRQQPVLSEAVAWPGLSS